MNRRNFLKVISGSIIAVAMPVAFALQPKLETKIKPNVRTFISPKSGDEKFAIDVIFNKVDHYNYATHKTDFKSRWLKETKVDWYRLYGGDKNDFEYEQADLMYDEFKMRENNKFMEDF